MRHLYNILHNNQGRTAHLFSILFGLIFNIMAISFAFADTTVTFSGTAIFRTKKDGQTLVMDTNKNMFIEHSDGTYEHFGNYDTGAVQRPTTTTKENKSAPKQKANEAPRQIKGQKKPSSNKSSTTQVSRSNKLNQKKQKNFDDLEKELDDLADDASDEISKKIPNANNTSAPKTSNSNEYTRIENEKVDVKDPEFCARTVMCITTNLWQNKTQNCSGATDDWMKKAKGINVSQYKQSNQSDEYNKNDYQVAAISQICGSDVANNYKMEKKENSSNLSSKCEEFCVPDNDEKIVDDWRKCSEEAHKKYGEGKDALYKYQQYRKTTACDKEKYQDELRKDAQKIVDTYNKKLKELKKASESQPAAE